MIKPNLIIYIICLFLFSCNQNPPLVPCTDDSDNDGICSEYDICEGYDDNQDQDYDGIPDGCDVCPGDELNDIDEDQICGDVDEYPYCFYNFYDCSGECGGNAIEDSCGECNGNDNCNNDSEGGCLYDFTGYGATDCDAAWDAFGIDCTTLEITYGWDCVGCECPGDNGTTTGGTTGGGNWNSCVGNCGGSAGECWCDDLCISFGDCCPDYYDECR